MADMLVKLYNLKSDEKLFHDLLKQGIQIKRALSPDRRNILEFIKKNFEENYVDECKSAFTNNPITCYIATKNKKIIGWPTKSAISFYEKTVQAEVIEDSFPDIYKRMIEFE